MNLMHVCTIVIHFYSCHAVLQLSRIDPKCISTPLSFHELSSIAAHVPESTFRQLTQTPSSTSLPSKSVTRDSLLAADAVVMRDIVVNKLKDLGYSNLAVALEIGSL